MDPKRSTVHRSTQNVTLANNYCGYGPLSSPYVVGISPDSPLAKRLPLSGCGACIEVVCAEVRCTDSYCIMPYIWCGCGGMLGLSSAVRMPGAGSGTPGSSAAWHCQGHPRKHLAHKAET